MGRHSTPDKTGRGGTSQNTNATPGSQGGESVTTEAILARLKRAKEIEAGLESIAAEQKAAKRGGARPSPDLDQKSQALRLQLCEVLSDVILNDSQLAHDRDAIGRLWKNCFYGRINDIRSRIAREKSRAKKRQAGGGEGGSGGAEAAKRMVGDLERQLKQFLKEAIQLYRYIIERYVKELTPLSQSQNSAGSDGEEEERERTLVIIASLYRMHIHLGDLFRYSSQHKHAEECYLKSAKLAPGTGNPFNQLAVVAQQSQDSLTVLALYYYARSLMASREPFETSRSNLVRLFESNKKWLDEHSRDDEARPRGIVNAAPAGASKKAAQEWRQKERAAANRQALARLVDLQWDFFRGVALDGRGDGRIDLEGLRRKMAGLRDALAGLIDRASFGEGLLCKVVAVLAFSTLGAGNHGRPIAADGLAARRERDPGWNEGIAMTNQALAFSFFLRTCAALARDADAVLARKDASRLGAIRSLAPLLLGFRFAASLYEGCDWFHGLPFFPDAGDARNAGLESSSVHKMCTESHAEFWKSIASLANRIDTLPMKRDTQRGDDLASLKDFAEYHGYVPFTSFLDAADDAPARVSKKATKYATAEEVVDALSDKKHAGGVKGVEAETRLKINLILSIAERNTNSDGDEDGQHFLFRNPETKMREFVTGGMTADEGKDPDNIYDEETVSKEQAQPPDQESNVIDENNVGEDKAAVGKEEGHAVPLKMSYSDKGMALLTPAALLAGVGDEPQTKPPMANNKEAMAKSSSVLPVGSILDSTIAGTPNLGAAATAKGVDLLANSLSLKEDQESQIKAPLPPPPGFSMQKPPGQRPQLPLPFTGPSTTGISLAQFAVPRQAVQNAAPFRSNQPAPPGMMPQAGPSYPTSSMFETMNPFAQAPLPSFNNNFVSTNPPSNLNQSRFLNAAAQGSGVNLQQHASTNGGLDPTLDFLFSSNNQIQTSSELLTPSNALDPLVPPPAAVHHEPEDPSESIMKFLFEPSNDASTRAGQPLYASRGGQPPSQHHGMPHTENPFAT